MNLTDIIALAKAGYSPKDIKDLVSLASDVSEKIPPEEEHHEEAVIDGSDEQKDAATPEEKEQALDYKQLYEEQNTKIVDLEKKLEEMQKNNTRQNMQGEKPDNQKVINDLARSFM